MEYQVSTTLIKTTAIRGLSLKHIIKTSMARCRQAELVEAGFDKLSLAVFSQ